MKKLATDSFLRLALGAVVFSLASQICGLSVARAQTSEETSQETAPGALAVEPSGASDVQASDVQIDPSLEESLGNVQAPTSGAGASAEAAKKRNGPSGVAAVVKTDGAIVYRKPDFDSDVLINLVVGQAVRVSRGTVGSEATGRFHKVRAGNKLGYIADIDVTVEGGATAKKKMAASSSEKTLAQQPKNRKTKKRAVAKNGKASEKRRRDRPKLPMYFSRFVGILIGQSGYRESISGVDANTNFTIYGLKITGADVLLAGPVMDLNLALHYGAPSYYDSLSKTKPTGFVLLTDALLMVPFVQMDNANAYIEAGPLLVLSNIKTTTGGAPRDMTALNFGLSFALGGAVRIDKVALRLEAKHFLEKQSYQAVQFSVQNEF